MNKLVKVATMVAGVGAMLNFAGCGDNSPRGEYEKLYREASVLQGLTGQDVEDAVKDGMSKYDGESAEKQKKSLETLKKEVEQLKAK